MYKVNKYHTKQKDCILNYLIENKEKHITVNDIITYFKAHDISVGKTTIYRHIDSLLKENKVRKYIIEEGRAACYQYSGEHGCVEHYHLKCDKCGDLFHIDCKVFDNIGSHLYQDHKFTLDLSKTVLYGTCKNCTNKQGGKNE